MDLDFILKITNFKKSGIKPQNLIIVNSGYAFNHKVSYFMKDENAAVFEGNDRIVFIIGDLINSDEFEEKSTLNDFLRKGKGFFYVIIIHNSGKIEICSSIFSILPVYIYNEQDLVISSSLENIIKNAKNLTVNPDFLIENILFNYPLFNDTFIKEIKLLSTNSILTIKNNKLFENTGLDILDFVNENPKPYKRNLPDLAELFISLVDQYIPEERSAISFTSGFDGRTLVAVATFLKKRFMTYSFSAPGFADIDIPIQNCKELGLEFVPVYLDTDNYINQEFVRDGNQLISITGGVDSYIYAQFLYSAKLISKYADVQVNGLFGSELFRAAHIYGAFTSYELVKYFELNENEWIGKVFNSPKKNLFNEQFYQSNIDSIITKLRQYSLGLPKKSSQNIKFYSFIFNEVFRKLFGSHIKGQFNDIVIRSPFLDFDFLQSLLRTDLAGIYNDFFTHNPLKRYKGQVFYAEVIKKTNRTIFNQKTGKGYKPSDLISWYGKLNISKSYFQKKISRKTAKPILNNLGIVSAVSNNKKYFESLNPNSDIFNTKYIKKNLESFELTQTETARDTLIKTFSLNYLINKYEKNFPDYKL